MKILARASFVALLAAAVLVLPAGGAAAPASTTFSIVGYEYAFTSTVGHFAGTATGNAVDAGAWNTKVEHDPLGSTPTYVNGGSFQMATHSSGWSVDEVHGTFVHHGGTITTLDAGAGCTNQRYAISGRLRDVSTRNTSGGTGVFGAVLTHYRVSILGHCVAYKARVAGSISFSY